VQGRCGLIIGNLGASAATTWEESTPNPAPWMILVLPAGGAALGGLCDVFDRSQPRHAL